MFFESCSDNDELCDTIACYTQFCEELCIPVKTKKYYPNNKPWVDNSVRAFIPEKQTALKSGDQDLLRSVRARLKR